MNESIKAINSNIDRFLSRTRIPVVLTESQSKFNINSRMTRIADIIDQILEEKGASKKDIEDFMFELCQICAEKAREFKQTD